MSDYIKREVAIEQIKKEWAKLPLSKTTGFAILMRVLRKLPAADVIEQKNGQWIRSVDELGEAWMCSECLEEFFPADGMEEFISYVHFCPNCGARMAHEESM